MLVAFLGDNGWDVRSSEGISSAFAVRFQVITPFTVMKGHARRITEETAAAKYSRE
jgi:hypothetical protein